MQCDGPDAVDARRRTAWLSRVGERDNERDVQMRLDQLRQWRVMSRRTRQGPLLLLPGRVCALCTQAGWDVRGLAVVYDDVCGKQAIECWIQASAQKQEVREEQRNKPGRQGEVLRSTGRGREERVVP